MNLNKTFGRVATTFVAATMLASVSAVPAFAESTPGVQGGTSGMKLDKLVITKELDMPTGVVTTNAATFKFTLSAVNADTNEKITSGGTTFDVKNGTGSSVDNEVTFAAQSKDEAKQSVEFSLEGFKFTDPGVYKYQITETMGTGADDFTNATGNLDVYLFVEDTNGAAEGGCQIYAAVVAKDVADADKATTSAKTDKVVNSYMMDATGSLKVTKNIDGTMASPNDKFTFTVSGLTPNRTYVVSGTGITAGSNDKITANENGEYQFTLKATETRTILGLTAKEYVVTETLSDKGYKLTSVTGKDDDDSDISDGSADVTLTTEQMTKNVTFLNTRNAVSPTGIVMDVAPYALLVVVAAAGCFVFLRKRRED